MPQETVFEKKQTVFFVGGRGDFSGNTADTGGVTKAAWEGGAFNKDMAKVMTATGAPIISEPGLSFTEGDDSKLRILGNGLFGDALVGHIANLVGVGWNYDDGRFEVIVRNDDWIEIDVDYIDNVGLVNVRLGGAFPNLQNLVDYTSAGSYSVWGYTNKDETLDGVVSPAAAIDFDTTGGSIANNSQFIVEGFHTTPGDMNRGGAYYQSPLDALKNGVDTNKCVSIDANAGAYDVITINNFDGLVLKNLYLHNTNQASGSNCVEFITNPVSVTFINCRFDDAYGAFYGTVYSCSADGCYVGNDFAYAYISMGSWYGGLLDNCVFNGDGRNYVLYLRYVAYKNCLFYKSTYGVYVYMPVSFFNCVFYGQTISCIRIANSVYGSIHGHNNIFMPAVANDYVVYVSGASGSVCTEALLRSCIWTVAGVAVTNHVNHNGNNSQLEDVIEKDPLFVDPANYDFRPRNPAVLRGGKPVLNGNPSQIGVISQKYQFARRAKQMNLGRLQIIR